MTLHLIDIASYQRGINLDTVRAAGFSLVNIKTSQGVGYTFSDAVTYARAAQTRGMGISCFHWLDNSASGAAQADYCWRTLSQVIAAVGHPVALQVDNEDPAKPATWAITRDFVHAIADRMGHLPFMYTGDWWATAGGRAGWDVHSLTPWLMAAPDAGYSGSYPGDSSGQWRAGYWGYTDLALMQYAVSPIAGAGGGNVSKAAIRDPKIWAALTGGTDDMALSEIVHGTATATAGDRNVEQIFHDAQQRRSMDIGELPVTTYPASAPYRRLLELPGRFEAEAAADRTRDEALKAAFNAVVAASGGTLEAAPILAAVQAAADEVKASVATTIQALRADLAAAEADRHVLEARLAEVYRQAAADDAPPAGTGG